MKTKESFNVLNIVEANNLLYTHVYAWSALQAMQNVLDSNYPFPGIKQGAVS